MVYASFQNHWHPSINIPVLTIVGTCNTNVSRPFYTRFQFGYGHLEFHLSTTSDQHTVSFDIPIFVTQRDADKKTVLDLHFNADLPDQLTSYIIRLEQEKEPLAKINIWNLSVKGCHQLHVTNILQPQRLRVRHEVHVLGLTGMVDKVYRTIYYPLDHPTIRLLDEEDLVAIGYRNKRHGQEVPSGFMPPPVARNDITDRLLTRRMTPQKAAYYNLLDGKGIEIPGRYAYITMGNLPRDPTHYPPPNYHQEKEESTEPDLFPQGHQVFRQIELKPNITTDEIITDIVATYQIPKDVAIQYISNQYQVAMVDIYENLQQSFHEMIKDLGHYNVTYHIGQIYKPLRTTPPPKWIQITQHPLQNIRNTGIAYVNEGDREEYERVRSAHIRLYELSKIENQRSKATQVTQSTDDDDSSKPDQEHEFKRPRQEEDSNETDDQINPEPMRFKGLPRIIRRPNRLQPRRPEAENTTDDEDTTDVNVTTMSDK